MRPAEGGAFLAVEVAFQAMADGLVKQDAGPAIAEHDGHQAGRGRAGAQVDPGLVHGRTGKAGEHLVTEAAVVVAPAATAGALLATTVLFHDHRHRDPHQGAHVGRQVAIAAGHHHHLPGADQTGHDLLDPRIFGPGHGFEALQQLDLADIVEGVVGVVGPIEGGGRLLRDLDLAGLATPAVGDGPCGVGGILERLQADVVGVGKGRLLAGDGAHTDTLLDVEAARLDDAFLQAPGLGAVILEIKVGVVELVAVELAEDLVEILEVQVVGLEQQLAGKLEGIGGGILAHGLSGMNSVGLTDLAVAQRRQACANLGDAGGVQVGHHHTGAFGQARQHLAPGVNDHAVAPGAAAAGVTPALGTGEHVALVFDGPGTQQDSPSGPGRWCR
jgi:hypothetical protein